MDENTDECAKKYICATALYLLSMLSNSYNIVIDRIIWSLGHGKYVVDGLNATDNFFLTMLITTVQLHGKATKD